MKTFKEIREASDVSSSHAQHMLGNDAEKKAHSAFMQKKHGVKTTYHGSDELKYHGPKKNVKKALGTHYGGDHDQAKDDHPHIYKENVKTADKKPEIYTKPDGKKGTRMVPVDREVIKQEKNLEWLKAALAKEAAQTKPRQDDMEEDVKEAEIPHGKTIFTKKPEPSKKDQKTIKKIQDLMKRANEDVNEVIKHTHAAIDKKGLAIGFASHERDAKDMARRNNGKVVKLKKPMSDKKTDMMINRPFKEDVSEISKGMASRYIKKSQVSTADAAKSVERGNIDSKSPDRDIAKAGKAQAKKGIKTFINRNKGTSTAVDKLTGKAKVPAREGMAQGIAKQKISREKEMDARRHDRMMDRARMKDAKKKNMSELSMSMKDLTKTGLNKHASPDKDKIRKGLDALKKAGNAKADAEAGERRKKMSELSNNKMGQYVRKAADDAAKKGAAGDTKKAQARVKGVNKAMDKIDHNRLFGRSGTTYSGYKK